MKHRHRWLAILLGAGLAVATRAIPRGGFLPWPNLLAAHGIALFALGILLLTPPRHVRWGVTADWRNRVTGAMLALALSVAWRAAVGLLHGLGATQVAWLGYVIASGVFLVPAVFCWGYVFTTFYRGPGPDPRLDDRPATAQRTPRAAA